MVVQGSVRVLRLSAMDLVWVRRFGGLAGGSAGVFHDVWG